MDFESFKQSTTDAAPPGGLSPALEALWQDAKGAWDTAHGLAQSQKDTTGAWVHAYLHRVEGDLSNARYWYRRAGRPACAASLAEEWEDIARALL